MMTFGWYNKNFHSRLLSESDNFWLNLKRIFSSLNLQIQSILFNMCPEISKTQTVLAENTDFL